MARKATGAVIPPKGKQRSWAIRFTANGSRRYVTLGRPEDGWNRQRAEAELEQTLAQLKLGQWQPPSRVEAPPADEPTFHEFASQWFERHRPEWRERTVEDYQWALSYHLLPYFADHRLNEIAVEAVDRYKAAKLREGKLAPAQINMTLVRLAQVLEEAVEYGHLVTNPASGRRRRVKASRPPRSWVEPEQLPALLAAADAWRRPVIATLAGAGLRVGEAVGLEWRDVNLATGTLTVRESKTDAGAGRRVDMPGGLVDELAEWRARSPRTEASDPVFVTRHHTPQTKDNIGRRLKGTIKRANEQLARLGIEPISERVSPHSLRRTYASLRAALRDDPVYIAEQGGWTDPHFALSVYAKAAKRRERLPDTYREAFDRALQWAEIGVVPASELAEVGRIGSEPTVEPVEAEVSEDLETRSESRNLTRPGA
jgi:integrase